MEIYGMTTDAHVGISLVVGALGCLLLCTLAIYLQWWKHTSSTSLPLPPGSFGFLWVGETFKYLNALRRGDPDGFLHERTTRFASKTFKTNLFFRASVVVQGVAANRFVAAAENKQQLLNSWPASLLAIIGKHTPIAKHGPPHRRLRQIMASCLGPLALRKLVSRADYMTNLHFATSWKADSQLSLVSTIGQHTFRIACCLLAGIEDEALAEQIFRHFKAWTDGMISLPLDLPVTTYGKAKKAKKMLEREMGQLIDGRVKSNRLQGSGDDDEGKPSQAVDDHEDLLGMLLRARDDKGSFLRREELQEVILFLLLAGFDTTTGTLSFVLKFLEQNPACYHRLLQEQKAISSQKSEGEGLTWEDVQSMKYTWAVIQETLRISPPIPIGMKEATHDLTFDGYKIPKGWKMTFTMSATHYDEQFFPQPSTFDPSRFDIERLREGRGPPPYAFIPFGIGHHSCSGGDFARMTMSIYLHHLALSQLKWISIDPNEKVYIFPTTKLAKGYPANICHAK